MIRLGVCTGLENACVLAKIGFDYIETSLASVAALGQADFQRAQEGLARSGIACEAMNVMLPEGLPVVGPAVDLEKVGGYLAPAFDRAQALGVGRVVFGSGASRRVPVGFPQAEAWRQLARFLALAGRLAGERGIQVAIEPLRREECNILHFVSEAVGLAALLGLPQVGVLGDTYHMHAGGEPLSALEDAGALLWHVHMAEPYGRGFPAAGDGSQAAYQGLFQVLGRMGYQGRVSVEGSSQHFEEDAQASFALLDRLRRMG